MKGVLSYTDEELVSSDFIHNVSPSAEAFSPLVGRLGVFGRRRRENLRCFFFFKIYIFFTFASGKAEKRWTFRGLQFLFNGRLLSL